MTDETGLPQPPFARPDAFIGPPPPTGYSRWVKSDISFGPVGRVALTVLLFLPVLWGLVYSLVAAALWLFVVYPLALRSIWKRIAIRN